MTAFPQCIVIPSILSRSLMTSAVHASSRDRKIKMAVKANSNAMAKVFKGRLLLFVHCVSDKDLTLIPLKFSCIQVVCREIHVSFTKELSVRRVTLTPIMVNGKHISEFFNGLRSSAIVQVDSSCDFMFMLFMWLYIFIKIRAFIK